MNTVRKTILVSGLLLTSAAANADFSANVGYASEYYYRGIFQKNSSASAGLDYEAGGFYAGTWAADVGQGLEIDLYGGYGADIGELNLSVGFTGYYYTGEFDDTYQEINLGAGFGGFTLDVAIGEWDNNDGPTQDYTYYSLTYEANGFYGKYGGFTQDFDGNYFEAGYGTTISEIDVGIALIISDESLVGDDDEAIIFSIGKSFDL